MSPRPQLSPTPDLFAGAPDGNLLPCDGVVLYFGPVLEPAVATQYFAALMTKVAWRRDEAVIFGRRVVTARKVAWYGDERFLYRYSGATKEALPWIEELRELRHLAEERTGATYNSCLANLYHHGGEGVSWHSDGEPMLARHAPIASVTLGAERKFVFKHKRTAETVSVTLEHGSLLVMKGETQTHWLHSLPKMKRVVEPRVNLTFRTIERGVLSAE